MPQGLSRGTRVRIISSRYAGRTGTVEANVFQKTVDYPDDFAHGYRVTLDDVTWVKLAGIKLQRLSGEQP